MEPPTMGGLTAQGPQAAEKWSLAWMESKPREQLK